MRVTVAFSVASIAVFVLQGCGGEGDDDSTTTPAPPKDHVCFDDGNTIKSGQCCCLSCGGEQNGTQEFAIVSEASCLQQGGQCKTSGTSVFQRPPPAKHAGALCDRDGENDFQRHLVGGEPDWVQVVFLGENLESSVQVQEVGGSGEATMYTGEGRTYSIFNNPSGWNGYEPSTRGDAYSDCWSNGFPAYKNSTCYYTSEPIHRVNVTGLKPGTPYQYKVSGSDQWVNFTTPPALGEAITLGFTADLGQTDDSKRTMEHMKAFVMDGKLHHIVFPGDLSYADGASEYWDTFGRLADSLFGSIPTAYGVGNHEFTSGNENFQAFTPRYSWPKSNSPSPLWFSYDTGSAHIIMLCSYCDTSSASTQLAWLKNDLEIAEQRRNTTPWIVAAWHTPWYTSSSHHPMSEANDMRLAFEPVIYKHVDFVVSGHVHAYERTENIYENKTDACGPVYITIGDGGNQEGPACGWEVHPWSAAKEFSYGFGTLEIMNGSTAKWSWYRNQDDLVEYDSTILSRPSLACDASPAAVAV